MTYEPCKHGNNGEYCKECGNKTIKELIDEQAAKQICSICADNHLASEHLEE